MAQFGLARLTGGQEVAGSNPVAPIFVEVKIEHWRSRPIEQKKSGQINDPPRSTKMEAGIFFKKLWSDDDCVEIEVVSSDGASSFCTRVYIGHQNLEMLVADLDRFKVAIHGGIYDVRIGEFGPEFANGAFHARLHFYQPGHGRLFTTVHAESAWHDFTSTKVASEATLHLTTEPVLFDNFVEELRELQTGKTVEAALRLT